MRGFVILFSILAILMIWLFVSAPGPGPEYNHRYDIVA